VYGVEAERALARNVSAWDGRRSTWLHSPLIRSLWVIFKKPLVVTGVIRLLASFVRTLRRQTGRGRRKRGLRRFLGDVCLLYVVV
jgi:hypothetical protein